MDSPSFEDEILALNPEYDLIFGKNEENRTNLSPLSWELQRKVTPQQKMKIISKMHKIIGIKPVGELPSEKDWEDNDSNEKETIKLMRKLGLEPSIDRPPDEKRTISTVPLNEDVIVMRNGRKKMSIFMDNSYFELKPRSDVFFDSLEESSVDEAVSLEASTKSDFSDDVNLYKPISFNESSSTNTTTLSEESFDKPYDKTESKKKIDSGESFNSSKQRSPKNKKLGKQFTSDESSEECRSYTWEGRNYQRLNNSSSSSQNRKWTQSREKFSDVREESNWRMVKSKPTDSPTKSKANEVKPKNVAITKQIETRKPEIERENVQNQGVERENVQNKGVEPQQVSSKCEVKLLKPKELFLKKKAMMLQQVLAEYHS